MRIESKSAWEFLSSPGLELKLGEENRRLASNEVILYGYRLIDASVAALLANASFSNLEEGRTLLVLGQKTEASIETAGQLYKIEFTPRTNGQSLKIETCGESLSIEISSGAIGKHGTLTYEKIGEQSYSNNVLSFKKGKDLVSRFREDMQDWKAVA